MERDVEAGELWIVPFPSGTPRRILSLQPMGTTVGTVDHRVSWTADSRHLILDGPLPAAAGNHLHLVDTDRSTIRSITPGTGEEWTPAVSPAGDTIAFAAGGVDFDLVQISLDGGDIRPLLASARSESAPAWSRSGGQIAYVTNAAGASEIWLRNMQEGFARPIVSAASARSPWRALERPSFSPDGQRIVYGVVGLGSHALVIAPSTGGQPVGLDRDSPDHHGASWSPDGNWLAYTRLVKVGENWELVKAPLSGGPPVRLAPAGDGGSETAWSPTGEWIAQVRNRTIHLVSADGATEKPLNLAVVPAGGRPGTFGFSTDGSLLYVIRANDQQWQLLAVEVPSGGIRSTTKLNLPISASVVGFSLHPDGKSIATSVGTNKYDLWLLEGFQPRAPWWRRLVS
jgi:Tol biopolymer transport system component